jgi:tetratricopeptide (TPR) repeat protein
VKSEAVHREHFKQFDSAAELYEGLIKDYPNDPDSHFSLAMNLIALGGDDRAIAELEKARQLDPAYVLGYIAAAEYYNRQKAPEIAIKVLEKAERLAPAEVLIWDSLANLHHNQGNYRKAEAYYRKVLATDPSSPGVLSYLGDSLFYLGQYQEALLHYQQAISVSRRWQDSYLFPNVWLQLALTQDKLGRTSEAIATLDQFLSEQPDAPTETISEARQHLARMKTHDRDSSE